jgi:predicted transposase YbfD/YdcC
MTRRARRNHTAAFKAKVALTALKGEKTLSELVQQFDAPANQVKRWKHQLLEGAVITHDAKFNSVWGCQRDVAAKIIEKKADYILALKGNQGALREEAELFADGQTTRSFADAKISTHQTADADHGRLETRKRTVIHDVGWLQARRKWLGLKGVLMVESKRGFGGEIERETRFHITSLTLEAKLSGPMIRDHWAVKNGLRWTMDMTFRDDDCRIRTEHAPANFTTLGHMAHNLYRKAPGKDSIRLRRKTAAWDDVFLVSLMAA